MFSIIRSGLDAANKDLAVISNNIANAGTNGFKRSEAQFEDFYILFIIIQLKKLKVLV